MGAYTEFVVLLLLLLALLSVGVPIGISMGLSAVLGILAFVGPRQLVQVPLQVLQYGMSEGLLVVPMFIAMAEVIRLSGAAEGLFEAVHAWAAWLPGSLASTAVLASAQFAAISGSSTATVATIGIVSLPEMLKKGYSRKLACGAVASGGVLGILIPPSLIMVIYGIVTGTSITKLFIAGVVPGLLVTALLVGYITLYATFVPDSVRASEPVSWEEKVKALPKVFPLAFLALVVLGSLYTGVTTVTEAAGLGAAVAFALTAISKRLSFQGVAQALRNTCKTTGMIFLIVFGGMVFAYLMTMLQIPQQVSKDVVEVASNRWAVLLAINVVLLVLGCFLDGIAIVVITIPFFAPIVQSLGFDLVWFGVMVTINVEIGLLTPPVGLNLFVLRGIAPPAVRWQDIILGALPFCLVLLCGMLLISWLPQLALWLPSRM